MPIVLPRLVRFAAPLLLALPAAGQRELYRIHGLPRYPIDGSVAPMGDLDHDGATDFLVGGAGGAISGRTGKWLFRLNSPAVEGQSGNVGDVDGDGFDDVLLFGWAVYSGDALRPKPGVRASLRLITYFSPDPSVETWSLGGALPLEDLDGDGDAEVLVGFPDASVIRCGGDVTTLTHGDTGGFGQVHSASDGALLWAASGAGPGDALGGVLARVSDMDGDGLEDVVLGTRYPSNPFFCNLPGGGYVEARSAASGALLWVHDPPQYEVPIAAAAMDDVDGDAVPDLALGFPWSRPVQVRSGANGALLWTIESDGAASEFFGYRLYPIDDLDGDTVRDLVIAAPQRLFGTPSSSPGYVRIVSGTSGAEIVTLRGDTLDAQFGLSVAVLGDVNGDGTQELAIGTPWTGSGLVQVLSIERVARAVTRKL